MVLIAFMNRLYNSGALLSTPYMNILCILHTQLKLDLLFLVNFLLLFMIKPCILGIHMGIVCFLIIIAIREVHMNFIVTAGGTCTALV